MRRRQQISVVLAALTVIGLNGCTAFGPKAGNPTPPELDFRWTEALQENLPRGDAEPPPLRERVTDPQLAQLLSWALSDNPDAALARERIMEARALVGADLAPFRPQLSLGTSVTEQRLSENGVLPAGRIPGFEANQTLYEASFDATWELDLFGRGAAVADLGAMDVTLKELELTGVEESLVAEIVRRLIEHRAAAAERELLTIVIDSQAALLAATERRRAQGEASDLDVERAAVGLLRARSRLPGVERALRVASHQLATLTGRPPAALALAASNTTDVLWTSVTAFDTTSTAVLRRRPDVQIAELRYAQAVRQTDLAKLDFYPRISLFAAAGPEATDVADLTDPKSLASAIGGLIEWAAFDGGRRQSALDAVQSRETQQALHYRQTLLAAAAEVESSVATLVATEAERALQHAVTASLERIEAQSKARFEGGTVSRLVVLEATRDLADARISAERLDALVLTHSLALEKALGSI